MTDPHVSAPPINTAQNTDTQHVWAHNVWKNTRRRDFNGIFLCQCLSAMFQAIAWQCFTSIQKKGLFFFPFYLELWTQLYKHSTETETLKSRSQHEAGKRNSWVWHHTWWATMNSCRVSKRWGYKIKPIHFKLSGRKGGEWGRKWRKRAQRILEVVAATWLSVRHEAAKLISRVRVLNISSELK